MPKLMTLLEVLVLFYLVLCMIIGAVVGVVATLSGIFVLDLMLGLVLGLVLGCGLGWLSLAACGFIAFVLERAKGIAERRAIRRRFEAVSLVAPQRSLQMLRLVTLVPTSSQSQNPTDSQEAAFCGV